MTYRYKYVTSLLQKLNKSKYCADVGLLDQYLFQRCFQFYSSVTEFLFMALDRKSTKAEEREAAAAGKHLIDFFLVKWWQMKKKKSIC